MFDPFGQSNPWSLGSYGISQPLGIGMQTLAGMGVPYGLPVQSPWLQGQQGIGPQIGPQTWLGNPALHQLQHLVHQAQQVAQQVAQQAPQLAQQIPQLIQQNPQLAQQAPQLQFLPQLLQQASNLAQQIPVVLQQVTGLGPSPYTQGIGFGPFGLSPFSQVGGYGRLSPFGYGVGYGSHPFA